jgi:hypothetical protein
VNCGGVKFKACFGGRFWWLETLVVELGPPPKKG